MHDHVADDTGDRAQSTVWALLVVGLIVAASVAAGHLARRAEAQGRVRAVADLVALAGVEGGRDAAETVATANGAAIDEFSTDVAGTVAVTVRLRGSTATARARDDGSAGGSAGRVPPSGGAVPGEDTGGGDRGGAG